jgi:hypothetical protein
MQRRHSTAIVPQSSPRTTSKAAADAVLAGQSAAEPPKAVAVSPRPTDMGNKGAAAAARGGLCGMSAGVFAAVAYSIVSIAITLFNKVLTRRRPKDSWLGCTGLARRGSRGAVHAVARRDPPAVILAESGGNQSGGWTPPFYRRGGRDGPTTGHAPPCAGIVSRHLKRTSQLGHPSTPPDPFPQAVLSSYSFDSTMTLTLLQGFVTIVSLEVMKRLKYIDYPAFDWAVARKVAPLSFVFIAYVVISLIR